MAILLDAKGTSISVKIKEATDFDHDELRKEQEEAKKTAENMRKNGADMQFIANTEDNVPIYHNPAKFAKHIKQLQGVGEWVKGIRVFQD